MRLPTWALGFAWVLAGGLIAAETDARLADAAKRLDRPAIQALLAAHADVNAPQIDGTTALHWAAEQDVAGPEE